MHRKAPGIKGLKPAEWNKLSSRNKIKANFEHMLRWNWNKRMKECNWSPQKYSPDDRTNNLQNRSQIWEWELEEIKWNLQELMLALDTERVKGDESGEKVCPWRPTELCCGMMHKDSWSAEKCRIEVRLCGAAIIDWWACISEGSVRCIKVDLKAALNPIV